MRKIVVQTFATLDSVMQAPGGAGEDPSGGFAHEGWSVNYWDEYMGRRMAESLAEPYDLLLGRKTYNIFANYWPRADDPVITPKFNAAIKYVATSSPETLAWENSVALTGDVAEAVAKLKQGDGPTLSVQGSSQLVQALLANDLVDEFNLWIFPLVLGEGKRLFGPGAHLLGLDLVDSTTSSTGVQLNRYRAAAPREPGTFAKKDLPVGETPEQLAREPAS